MPFRMTKDASSPVTRYASRNDRDECNTRVRAQMKNACALRAQRNVSVYRRGETGC